MNIAEAKRNIINFRQEVYEIDCELQQHNDKLRAIQKDIDLCEIVKKDLLTEIKKIEANLEIEDMLKSIEDVEGVDTLTKEELIAIYTGMDKTNYNKDSHLQIFKFVYPRFIDLKRLVKINIDIKKKYSGWILESVKWSSSEETFPPINDYISTYSTPHGHKVTI
jgi:hypothetical protein